MIPARWFIFGIAVIVLGLGVGILLTPVAVDAKEPMACTEVVDRYHAFIQDGVTPPDKVVPNNAWADACEAEISRQHVLGGMATAVGGVVALGALVIRWNPRRTSAQP